MTVTPTARQRTTDTAHGGGGWAMPRVAVGAGKGGVGTSTVTALLACTAAAAGSRVLLVDLAPHFGGLAALLDVQPAYSLADVNIAPFVHRLASFAEYDLERDWPAVAGWYARLLARPAFARANFAEQVATPTR